MSSLSGFDSEAVGFDSVSQNKRQETSSSTQTSEFYEAGVGSQTTFSKECGSLASPEELNATDDVLKEYPPPGLNAFLRKVVPGMLEQLEQNDRELLYNSSDSDEEEVLQAKLLQEIKTNADITGLGSGDHQSASILSLTWSSTGRSLAVGVGHAQHARWCTHAGLVRVYCARARDQGEQLALVKDIADTNCVTVVLYHPSVAALLAYGTSSGEVVVCSLRDGVGDGGPLTSPSGAHGTRSVTALYWADAALANVFLTMMQIHNTGKRRGASDQILISSGADGTVCVWQVNFSHRVLAPVVCYTLNAARKTPAPDISCFDFIKSYPLRPSDEKVPDDVFVVGSTTGDLYLCGLKGAVRVDDGTTDPVRGPLSAHHACVLRVAFSPQRPGVLASLSTDSELRVYHMDQAAPIKMFCLDEAVSCMAWLPNTPSVLVLGLARGEQQLRLYRAWSGRAVAVEGLGAAGTATAIAVDQSGSCRIACGDSEGTLRIWEVPARRIRLTPDDLEF